MSLAEKLFECFKTKEEFTLQDAYGANTDKQRKPYAQEYMIISALNLNE